jgi:hypothetical protein
MDELEQASGRYTMEQMAYDDFSKARQKEFISRIQNFFNPDNEELLSLQEVKSIIRPKGESYVGMKAVSLDLIVGSEGRYHDFNQAFLPKHDYMKQRWVSIDTAHYRDVILPPVRLYEIGGLYFVRDGNHRVSVARMKGMESIDAEVISLNSEIKLNPKMTREELLGAVIQYEKDLFYEETYFGIITDCYDLDFTSPGQYDVILNHILVHKYYINQSSTKEIQLGNAIRSWYENVYQPIAEIIESERLQRRFEGKTVSDLYVWIVKYWDQLKAKYGTQYSLNEAAMDYAEEFGSEPKTPMMKLKERIGAIGARIFGKKAQAAEKKKETD